MNSDAHEALQRLREAIRSTTAAVWLDDARVSTRGGRTILKVSGAFQKAWFESRLKGELEAAFGGPVEVVADAAPHVVRRRRAVPRLSGPGGEFALRMVKAFAVGDRAAGTLLLLHGPAQSGKSLLAEWACRLGAGRAFVLDLVRLKSGRSRGLVPQKPLVVADGLEILFGRRVAQQTLCTIIDAVQDRGDRLLFTMQGHPANCNRLLPALRSRLLGGVLVPVEGEPPRRRLRRTPDGPPAPDVVLTEMKDVAATLFGVERILLEGANRRRTVVEARRTIMAAACRRGLPQGDIAKAFGLRSTRAVQEACRWAEHEEEKDRRYASVLHEVARVRPKS